MCRLRNIAMLDYQESVTTGQTDRRRTKWSLCAAMLRRRHNKTFFFTEHNMRFLLELAEEYQMEGIKKRCEEFLMNQERSLEMLVLAKKFGLKNIFKRCLEFAKTKTLEDLETAPERKNIDSDTLLAIYKGKIEMLRDYSNDLKQNEIKISNDRDLLRMEKENMKRSLQTIQKLWDMPNKRCFRHMSDNNYDYSCIECNEKIYREVRKLCGEGQHLRRYFPKITPKWKV